MKHPTSAPTTASRPTKRARIDSETKHTEKKKSKEPVSILKQKQKSTKSTSPTKSSNTHPAPSPSRKEKKKKEKSTPLPSQASLYAEGAQKKPNGTKTSPESKQLPSSFTLIAGSYEKLLYGIQCTISTTATTTTSDGQAPTLPSASSGIEFRLEPLFIFPAHVSCIKAVSASPNGGKWLATGSTDEIVKVWDLRRRKEIGGLMHHEGSITYLNFPSRSHLLSASEDGTLCLFRCRDWAVLRALRGHKGRVNCVAIHPSGKLALSVGKDRTLRMWDLMRGKGSASTKLGKEAETVHWSTDGALFAIQCQSSIDIYTTDMRLIHIIKHPSRIHDVKFCKRVNGEGEILLVGAEDKKVTIYDISSDEEVTPKVVGEMIGHSNRVKAVQTMPIALPSPVADGRNHTTIVGTVSSDGKMHVYDLGALPTPESTPAAQGDTLPLKVVELTPVAEYDTKGTRLTCLAIAESGVEEESVRTTKRKLENEVDEGEGDDDDEEDEWEPQHDDEEDEEEDEDENEEEED